MQPEIISYLDFRASRIDKLYVFETSRQVRKYIAFPNLTL